jgi:hypothetical protein
MRTLRYLLIACLWIPFSAVAGEPVIEDVVVQPSSAGGYNFSVTVRHEDEGWEHFADKWVILAPDSDTVLGERVLFHPHVEEQPFTRGLRAVLIPAHYKQVRIRVHDRKHRWANTDFVVDLPDR